MNKWGPITFQPLFMERVWGGRRMADELGKPLPPGAVIGESWELVDREKEQSVVDFGEFAGTTLHELWTRHRPAIFGEVPDAPRFPLLAKILDARDKLSVQVHPPAALAAELKGEPKTEMWYVLGATPDAELYVGFRPGVTRETFAAALAEGHAAEQLHRIPVRAGDCIFIPSGRCHAIGAGCLLVEIQQNSDTTYRAFDWNRVGLDGKPRDLHVGASLRSMDFADYEPSLQRAAGERLVGCDYFNVDQWRLESPREDCTEGCAIFTVIEGVVACGGRRFRSGEFFLLPAAAEGRLLAPMEGRATVLRTTM
jgi:mannose-6-phosphate isomerase